jgi:hypothetical protein
MAHRNAIEVKSPALRAAIARRDTCSRRRAVRQGLSWPAATTRSARSTTLVVAIAAAMFIAATLKNGHSQTATEQAPDKEAPASMVLVAGVHRAPSSGQTIRTAETTPPAPVASPFPIRVTGPCPPGTPCPIPTPTRGHPGYDFYAYPPANPNPSQHVPPVIAEEQLPPDGTSPPEGTPPDQAVPSAKPTAIGEFLKRHWPPRKR